MTGAQGQITVQNFDRLAQAMNGLVRLGLNPVRMLDDLGMEWLTITQDRFEAERDPDGRRWEETQRGGAILRDTNRLYQSLTYEVEADGVVVGSNVVYAAIHQFGGTIKHAARTTTIYRKYNKKTGELGNRFVKKRNSNFATDHSVGEYEAVIPARPYLGVGAGDVPALEGVILDHIERALTQAGAP